jgi:hypothetical protein
MAPIPCGCTAQLPTVIVYDDGTAPPVNGNVVTIPNPSAETVWTGTQGDGIGITAGGPTGHTPTIALRGSPTSPIPIGYDEDGRLQIGPAPETSLVVNGGQAVLGGIRQNPGGAAGHSPTITVAANPSSPVPVGFTAAGLLTVGPIDPAGIDAGWSIADQAFSGFASVPAGATAGTSIPIGAVAIVMTNPSATQDMLVNGVATLFVGWGALLPTGTAGQVIGEWTIDYGDGGGPAAFHTVTAGLTGAANQLTATGQRRTGQVQAGYPIAPQIIPAGGSATIVLAGTLTPQDSPDTTGVTGWAILSLVGTPAL